jgi:hypothetical protein
MTHHKKHEEHHVGVIQTIGLLAAAGVVGAYYFYGKDAKKHQKKLKSWVLKFKAEVLEQLEVAKEMSEALYHTIIDTTATKFKEMNKIEHTEIDSLAEELKGHWQNITGHKED